jgi:hypothetical protein
MANTTIRASFLAKDGHLGDQVISYDVSDSSVVNIRSMFLDQSP